MNKEERRVKLKPTGRENFSSLCDFNWGEKKKWSKVG